MKNEGMITPRWSQCRLPIEFMDVFAGVAWAYVGFQPRNLRAAGPWSRAARALPKGGFQSLLTSAPTER